MKNVQTSKFFFRFIKKNVSTYHLKIWSFFHKIHYIQLYFVHVNKYNDW